jgi:hypothetical protein
MTRRTALEKQRTVSASPRAAKIRRSRAVRAPVEARFPPLLGDWRGLAPPNGPDRRARAHTRRRAYYLAAEVFEY